MTLFNLYGWQNQSLSSTTVKSLRSRESLKLSIVIPTLNQADTLEHTLLSILNQDYQNYEIIVIDGGSTDQTPMIIEKYQPWIAHSRFGIDSGQSDAINKGFNLATGNIFAWINSDDFYLPRAFSTIVNIFSNDQTIDIVVGAGDVITKDCRFLKRVEPMLMERNNLIRWLQGRGTWIMQQSCFWRSDLWNASGGVNTDLNLLMDVDLWFTFAKLGKSVSVDDPLAVMRYYPEIKTVSLKENAKEETAYILARHGFYSEVRQIVKELVIENKTLKHDLDRRNQKLVARGLKRLGLEL
jgi:glycosyltransferase involved in cell wall biosynthesis